VSSAASDRKSFDEKILMPFITFSLSVVFKTIIKKGEDFKDVIKLWAGPKLLIFLADPRDIELVLSSQVYLDKSAEYRFFKPWLGNGLLISSGEVKNSTSCLLTCVEIKSKLFSWERRRWGMANEFKE
jgi:hypothetical protein